MSKLRKLARGRNCQVRIPNVCNHNPDTVVLAHIRMAGLTGAGQKANDLLGAWCCSSCHDAIDRRSNSQYAGDELFNFHAEGVFRTIDILVKEGSVKI